MFLKLYPKNEIFGMSMSLPQIFKFGVKGSFNPKNNGFGTGLNTVVRKETNSPCLKNTVYPKSVIFGKGAG